MCVKEDQPLVDQCCTFCCKAVDFGTHDYCASHWGAAANTVWLVTLRLLFLPVQHN
ncbi:uncharacterized protein F4807DRAFT_465151 [Annulohypoxylon truncatum]|uniref:uncharacterized protein n=1 Tax=Annulohypoxylon truncatum TaxID=327061 RepID=UPI002008015C|nr:uncharacterized protein F4807DRAFT_465151 [Annulohypoxylon truncatum]KAI1204915.1 hypothetical protein F4807DRAFT_465151 [Annulohypoxylon truncatum]